jgi:sulfocyanin SoxE-like protein
MNRLRFLSLSLGSLCWAIPGTAQTAPSKWMSYDAASKTVTVALEAGAPGTAGPFNFNGYVSGGATLVVPPGSTVVINFVNHDGTRTAPRSSPTRIRCPAWAEIRPFPPRTPKMSLKDCRKGEPT